METAEGTTEGAADLEPDWPTGVLVLLGRTDGMAVGALRHLSVEVEGDEPHREVLHCWQP